MKGRFRVAWSWVVSGKLKFNLQCRGEWVVGPAAEDPGHKGLTLKACTGKGEKGSGP